MSARPAVRPAAAPLGRSLRRRAPLRSVGAQELTARRRRRVAGVATAIVCALGFVVLLALAAAQTVLVQGQAELDHLDQQLGDAQARYERLRLLVAQAEAPEHVVARAKELGLVEPTTITYLNADQRTTLEVRSVWGPGATPEPAATAAAPEVAWGQLKTVVGGAP